MTAHASAHRSSPSSRRDVPSALAWSLLALLAAAGCGGGQAGGAATAAAPATAASASAPAPYEAEILAWRAAREERLRSEDGWLTVVGLYWLPAGESRFGSGDGVELRLPAGPALAGTLRLEDGRVTLTPEPGAGLKVNGAPAAAGELRADADEGGPDSLEAGPLHAHLVRRGARLGLRVKDPHSPKRLAFQGIDSYPVDPAWRIEAEWEAYGEPVVRQVPTVIGDPAEMLATGRARFTVGGRELTLEPVLESPDDEQLFLIFGDATSGAETYGAGRFLYAPRPLDGKVILDFNKAYNPPCVFTPYATCPLPRPENFLPVPVTAGEKTWGEH